MILIDKHRLTVHVHVCKEVTHMVRVGFIIAAGIVIQCRTLVCRGGLIVGGHRWVCSDWCVWTKEKSASYRFYGSKDSFGH